MGLVAGDGGQPAVEMLGETFLAGIALTASAINRADHADEVAGAVLELEVQGPLARDRAVERSLQLLDPARRGGQFRRLTWLRRTGPVSRPRASLGPVGFRRGMSVHDTLRTGQHLVILLNEPKHRSLRPCVAYRSPHFLRFTSTFCLDRFARGSVIVC